MSTPTRPPTSTPAVVSDEPQGAVRDALDEGLRVLGLVCWVLLESIVVWPLVPVHGAGGLSRLLGSILLGTHLLLVLVGLWRRWWNAAAVWAVGVLGLVAYLVLLPSRSSVDPINYWAPGYWGLTWLVWVIIVLPRRTYLWVAWGGYGTVTLVDLAWTLFSGQPVTRFTLAPVPWVLAPIAFVTVFADGCVRLGAHVQARRADELAADDQRQEARARAEARGEAARLLHDTVLHALHAVGRAGGTAEGDMVREECRSALSALHHRGRDGITELGQLLRHDQRLADLGVVITGDAPAMPATPATWMDECVAAITAIMAGTGAPEVHLDHVDGQWHVAIRAGTQFPPTAEAVAGRDFHFGRIVEAMTGAGGEATMTHGHGQPTTMYLAWPQSGGEDDLVQLNEREQTAMRRILLSTSWPSLVCTVLMTALLAPGLPHWWQACLLPGIVVAVGCWYAWRLRQRPLGRVDAAVLLGTSVLAWYAALALVPPGVDHVYDLWIAWGSAALLHLVILQIPLRRGVAVMLGWAVLMTVGLYVRLDHVDVYRMHPLVTTGVGEAIVVLAGLTVVRRLVDQYLRQQYVLREVRRQTAHVQLASQVDHFWSERVTGSVMPLLRQVADGTVDPAVAARARTLEASLRDELTLGPERAPVLAELARLRQAGWEITSPMLEPGSEADLDATLPLLQMLGTPCSPGQRAMVSTSSDQATVVVLGADGEQLRRWREQASAAGLEADIDPDFVRIRRSA